MSEYDHVMYASISHITQYFMENYGSISKVEFGEQSESTSGIRGALDFLIGRLGSEFSSSVGRSEIHTINFEEEGNQIKQVVNDLLDNDEIPSVKQLFHNPDETGLYKFASDVLLKPEIDEFDDRRYYEVIGYEGDVKFRGMTSYENWGSRSNLLTALKSVQDYDTYPFQGVLTPVAKMQSLPDRVEYRVHYLFICAPDGEMLKAWYNRRNLLHELPRPEWLDIPEDLEE